MNPEGQEEK
jgi:hypothetical protein